jgi:hypothetical protein
MKSRRAASLAAACAQDAKKPGAEEREQDPKMKGCETHEEKTKVKGGC